MAKKYDDTDGIWRTIGGRRVFIRTGQSLSEAMIESGKFKNLREEYRKAKEEIEKETKNEYTKEELKEKYGTDDVDLINAGKEKEDRVSLKLSEKQIEAGNKLNEKGNKALGRGLNNLGKEDTNSEGLKKLFEDKENNKDGFTQQTDMYGGTREYSKEQLDKMEENGVKPMKHSYTGGGWEGTKYDSNLSTKEIAKNLNDYSKKQFPDVKLSRKTDYNGIDMYVMSSNKDMFVTDSDIDKMNFNDLEQVTRSNGFNWWAKDNVKDYNTNRSYSIDDVRKYAKESLNTTRNHDSNVSGNEWYLSDYGKKVISGLNKEMNSYNYDDSDGMVDYFNTNFYGYVHIGKWDKPYQVNESKSSGNQITNSLQNKAYQKYLKEHPNSKMTLEEFKKSRK